MPHACNNHFFDYFSFVLYFSFDYFSFFRLFLSRYTSIPGGKIIVIGRRSELYESSRVSNNNEVKIHDEIFLVAEF